MYKGSSFDLYDNIPTDMRKYLQFNGFNFSEKMAEFAISKMKDKDGNKYTPIPKEKVKELIERYNVSLELDNGANSWYVCNMLKSDYWGSGISDEQHLALSIKDYIDDKDAGVGSEKPFRYFFSICSGNGTVIPWKDCL